MADNQERINQIKQEDAIQRNLSTILQDRITKTGELTKAQKELVASTSGVQDLESKILAVQEEKEKALKKIAKFNRQADKDLLSQLDTAEKYLETEKEIKDNKEKQKDIQKELTDGIKEALGYSSELADLFAAGGVMALGAKAFTSAIEKTKEAFTATAENATNLYKSLGVSANEAADLAGDMQLAASTSLLYDMEDMSAAAGALSDKFGTTKHITQDMLKDVAGIASLTGDAASAADLATIFESAGADAGELTDEIKDIAQGVGVNASAVMKDMAANQQMMLGMSKEEIKILTQKTAELVKQGLSMEKMRGMSDNMLNIESSLKAEMKARQFGLGDMLGDTQAMRDAAYEIQFGDAEKGAEMMASVIKDAGLSTEKLGELGYKQTQMLAEVYGMTGDELVKMVQAQEENAELTAKYGESGAEMFGYIKAGAATALEGFKTMGVELVKLIAQYAIMNKMQGVGGKFGMGNLTGGGKGAAPAAPSGGAAMPEGGGKGMSGMTKAIQGIDAKKLLAGGAALVLVAASVFIFAKAVQEFMNVSWEAVGMAVVSMLALVAALALVGAIMMSGVGAVAILAGAAAMLVIAAALFVLGKAIQEIATGFGMMGELTTQLTALVMIAPALVGLAAVFTLLGLSMIPLAIGLALITPLIPVLLVLGSVLPTIANALGFGAEEDEGGSSGGQQGDPLLNEIKGLRRDIQAQPIQIVIDDKVVSTMNKKNVRMQGYRDNNG